MGNKNKLQKFNELATFDNVYQNFTPETPQLLGQNFTEVALKGAWKEKHFGNQNPITLELACGRGEYSLALAQKFPERNFIGVDIKGARIWKGAKDAIQSGLQNVAFLRTRIEFITHFFEKGEIDEIWITFPDPFPKEGDVNRRLSSPHFLNLFEKMLTPNGTLHLKTDDDALFAFTMQTLEDRHCKVLYAHDDIYAQALAYEELSFKTYYEAQHLAANKRIKYVRFQL